MGKNMILVTGHKGFIGSKLWEAVKGDNTFGIDLKDGDDLIDCALYPKVDTIFHLAANISVEESWDKPELYMKDIQILARLVKYYPNAKIIFAQSAASFDPVSPYGFSKWVCGEYLKKYHKNYVSCAFPNVFGGGVGVVDKFKGQDKVTVYGDGKSVRDYVHVDDIVRALLLAVDWETGEYQLGSEKGTTVLELAEGKEIEFAPARKEARESVLKNTTPNWKPIINVKEYLCQK